MTGSVRYKNGMTDARQKDSRRARGSLGCRHEDGMTNEGAVPSTLRLSPRRMTGSVRYKNGMTD
ncbi:MAG: hypothetical protein ACK5R4_00810 [Alphaproteobacteria bacterium]